MARSARQWSMTLAAGACVLRVGAAEAQQNDAAPPPFARSIVAPLTLTMPDPAQDTRGPPQGMSPSDARAWLEPLRLSLFADQLRQGGLHPNCATRESAPATGSFRWLSSHLTLFGATAGGCSIDEAGAAGVAFTQRLGRAWLVLSAASVIVPRSAEQASPSVKSDVRATIVFPRANNAGSYSVGVGRRGFWFGGTW